jgi:hypothetical protein
MHGNKQSGAKANTYEHIHERGDAHPVYNTSRSRGNALGLSSSNGTSSLQTFYGTNNKSYSGRKALVVEDLREACIVLKDHGYECERLTHNELMASSGEEYLGKLLSGEYSMLWIATPADWYVRTPGKRAGPHWKRVLNWMQRAANLKMQLVVYGPPGSLWKMDNFREAIEGLQLNTARLRLCHFGEQFAKNGAPSGSYIQVATNL